MNSEKKPGNKFESVLRLLEEALELPPAERDAWLRNACEGNAELEAELRSLLEAHDDQTPLPQVGVLEAELETSEVPDPLRIGRYRILERIAEGGMGTIYLAEQEEPVRRQVALKLVKLGMSSREVLSRFEAERQALAIMDHPNIARVYDGGIADDGRPYFAMEYVPGEWLTTWCDSRQLDLEERLTLFLKVCSAVQHAHQKGVIHRDLKPSNVLVVDVDGTPEPRIIDFGVAKAIGPRLTLDTLRTAHGLLLGTPEYMSPEQAHAGEIDIDTRTDVFSLGVLLYELLVGCLPFDQGKLRQLGLSEALRVLREEEPPRPSTRFESLPVGERDSVIRDRASSEARLRRELGRDLDWIVLRTLERDRDRRYPSASELAADLERYLHGEATTAGPPSLRYRAAKFVRRHRLGVATTTLFLLVIALSSIALSLQAGRLRLALSEAERQAERAQSVSEVLIDAFDSADPLRRDVDRDVTAREVLERAADGLDKRALSPSERAWLAGSMASAFLGVHDLERAEELLDEAVAAAQEVGDDSQHEVLVPAKIGSAALLAARSRFDESLAEAEQALALAREHGEEGLVVALEIDAQRSVAKALDRLGRFDDAAQQLANASALAEQEGVEDVLRAQIALDLATNAHRRADYIAARAAANRAVAFAEQAWANPLRHLESRFLLMMALFELGQRDEALAMAEADFRIALERLGPEHPRTTTLRNAWALQLNQSPRMAEALPLHEENVAISRRIDPESAQLASQLNNLGLTQLGMGLLAEAEATNREALLIQRALVGDEHPNVGYHRMNLARTLHAQGRYEAAEREYREASALWARTLPEGHTLRGNVAIWLGGLLVETARSAEGLEQISVGLSVRERDRGDDDWQTAEARSWYGASLAATGDRARAEALLTEAYEVVSDQRGTRWLRTRWALARVLAYYDLVGDEVGWERYAALWRELYGESPELDRGRRWALP